MQDTDTRDTTWESSGWDLIDHDLWARALAHAYWRPARPQRALAILGWIAAERHSRGAPATVRELARRLGVPVGSITHYVGLLRRARLVQPNHRVVRGLQLTPAAGALIRGWPAFGVPVLVGRRSAGRSTE